MSSVVRTPPLSRRERQVLELLLEGLTDKEIAGRLGIGCVTVRTYVARLMVKFGAANRTQLGRMAGGYSAKEVRERERARERANPWKLATAVDAAR